MKHFAPAKMGPCLFVCFVSVITQHAAPCAPMNFAHGFARCAVGFPPRFSQRNLGDDEGFVKSSDGEGSDADRVGWG